MKLLVLTHRLPYAPNRGDRIRAFHMLRELSRSAEVRLVSLAHDAIEADATDALREMGIQVWTARVPTVRNAIRALASLGTSQPLTHVLLDSPHLAGAVRSATEDWEPDAVFVYCTGIAPAALAPPLANVPRVIDFVDVDSMKWASLGASSRPPRSWIFRREAKHLGAFEATAAASARVNIVVNERERDALLRICPSANVVVIPNGVDVEAFKNVEPPANNHAVIFTGVFDYGPNVEGAMWLAQEVWPHVRASIPDAHLRLVGANPVRSIRALPRHDPSIEVTGSVRDTRPYLWDSAMAAAPLFTARGIQNKVLEAVAGSLPVVVTSPVWDGLPGEVRPACRLADDAPSFAAAIVELLSLSPAARSRLAARAALEPLAWRLRLDPLAGVIARAAGSSTDGTRAQGVTSRSRSPRSSSGSVLAPSR